jgi:hypothetical protein
VVQYRILGLDRFVSAYVDGWARNGFFYESIPLVRMAYELQGRFDLAGARFSVESEVVRALVRLFVAKGRPAVWARRARERGRRIRRADPAARRRSLLGRIAGGLGAALLLTRSLESLLFGVTPTDPAVLAG